MGVRRAEILRWAGWLACACLGASAHAARPAAAAVADGPGSYAGATAGQLLWVDPATVHPTQFALGIAEVRAREARISAMKPRELRHYLEGKAATGVVGPRGEIWIVDGHHLARALVDIGEPELPLRVSENWSAEPTVAAFMERMNAAGYLWLRDENGQPRPWRALLGLDLRDLPDDPYRSLARDVREEGGYPKSKLPFAEFYWAEFFRARIPRAELRDHPKASLKEAVRLAKEWLRVAHGPPGAVETCPAAFSGS